MLCLGQVGCHSAFMTATLVNRKATPMTLIEVDYPSASFGVQRLAPGEEYHYRFKVLGSGTTMLQWNEPSKPDQKVSGPQLNQGDDGAMTVTFEAAGPPSWHLNLTNRATH